MSRSTPRTESGRSLRRVLANRSRSLVLAGGAAAALGLTVAAACAAPALAAQPTNWFVAPNGTDTTGSCTANSQSNAFPTIQDAVACAAASGDVIVLAPTNGTPYPGIGTISQKTVSIVGTGARSTVVDVSNSPLNVTVGSGVQVTGVSLTFPSSAIPASFQPNVINDGELVLRSDMVTGNIYSPGIVNAPTSDNDPPLLLITNTTVSGNDDLISYPDGGGIFEASGSLFVQNSTIADNHASFGGAGIWVQQGAATLTDSTVADNQALGGGAGGIGIATGQFYLSNSLVASNTSTSGNTTVASDCQGTLTDGFGGGGSNLIGSPNSGVGNSVACTGLTNGINGDQIGVANPGVATAAADNGGPTDTVALLPGSPAIGTANAPTCEVFSTINNLDQRGDSRNAFTRNACDVGAYDTGGS